MTLTPYEPKQAKPRGERITKGYQVPESALVGFDSFWQAYPRKSAKGDAKLAWYQVRATERGLLATVLAALSWQVKLDQWRRDGGAYIPYPATWLRSERWEDVPTFVNIGASATVDDERARTAEQLRKRLEGE